MNGIPLKPHLGTTHLSPCVASQQPKSLPHHNAPHCGQPKPDGQHTIPIIWQQTKMSFQTRRGFPNLYQLKISSPLSELVDSLPAHIRDSYLRDFRLADDAFHSGQFEATSRGRQKYWDNWQRYAAPLGVDPYLQDTSFSTQIRLLSRFAARVRTGYYGKGNQVKICTVSSALTAVGQTIALACDANPTKVRGSECLLPRLQVMMDGY
jgi:hypothetical protein